MRCIIVAISVLACVTAIPLSTAQVTLGHIKGAPESGVGRTVTGIGDVDLDGRPDFAFGWPRARGEDGRIDIWSGRTLDTLFTMYGPSGSQAELGWAIASAGDVNADGYPDVIAGMTGYDVTGLPGAGGARVYSGKDGDLLYTVHGDGAGDRMGTSVCSPGDVNLDGHSDFLVGAPESGSPASTPGFGYARLFSGRDGTTLMTVTGRDLMSEFAAVVSGAGDMNLDGYPDFAVSSLSESNEDSGSGAVRVYSGRDGDILRTAYSEPHGDLFGYSVAPAGDLNGDGNVDLLIGALNLSSPLPGTVWAYSGADGATIHTVRGAAPGALHGFSLTSLGDLDLDGCPDFAVGAPWASSGVGAVHIYSGSDAAAMHTFTGRQGDELFGAAISTIGDVTRDGLEDLIVGVPGYSLRGNIIGRVSLFSSASATELGRGCAGANPPRLEVDPPAIGQTTGLYIGRAIGSLFGGVVVSLVPNMPVTISPTCTVYVSTDASVVAAPVQINGIGQWTGALAVPSAKALVGVELALQTFLHHSTQGFALSNGVRATIGG